MLVRQGFQRYALFTLCYAEFFVMKCYVIICSKQCYVMCYVICYVKLLCCVTSRCVMLQYIIICYIIMPCYVALSQMYEVGGQGVGGWGWGWGCSIFPTIGQKLISFR